MGWLQSKIVSGTYKKNMSQNDHFQSQRCVISSNVSDIVLLFPIC
jgi:hypothetical protein